MCNKLFHQDLYSSRYLCYLQQELVLSATRLWLRFHLQLLDKVDDVPQKRSVRRLNSVHDSPGRKLARNDRPHLAEEHLKFWLHGTVTRHCCATIAEKN